MTVQLEPVLSRRERTHAATVAEIKEVAQRHMAGQGTSSLNLRAVARDMGMTPSALYRYFASREALLTALIIDSYDELGSAVERAAAALDPGVDAVIGMMSVVHVFRDWALAHPPHWALLYGSPVPGYEAPEDTIVHMLRTTNVLLDLFRQALDAGAATLSATDGDLPPRLRLAVTDVCAEDTDKFVGLSHAATVEALSCWCTILGAVSTQVYGQLPPALGLAPQEFFDWTVTGSLAQMGFDLAPWRAAQQ